MDMEHERRLTEVEQRSISNSYRLDDIEKRQEDQEQLISTVAVLASRQETVERDVKEIKSDVKKIAGKPGQRWEAVADKLIWAVLASVVGFVLARIGL